ncbi:MAG: hypothetical protein ABF241_08430 [Yoonia sp.]
MSHSDAEMAGATPPSHTVPETTVAADAELAKAMNAAIHADAKSGFITIIEFSLFKRG